jgi:hypothetical protein
VFRRRVERLPQRALEALFHAGLVGDLIGEFLRLLHPRETMARGGRRQPPRDRELIPIGSIFGAREFAHHYPDEMMRLGCLTAFWSVVEDQFCMVLGMLLQTARKAEAAYYPTVNFKARCDLVRAISAQLNLDNQAKEYLNGALDVLSDATDARNNLMHGLFKMEPYSGALVSVRRRTATKSQSTLRTG